MISESFIGTILYLLFTEQELFERARVIRQLTIELSGALGVRTKFQTKQTAQVPHYHCLFVLIPHLSAQYSATSYLIVLVCFALVSSRFPI
jgi:hypothetical protein